MDDLIEQTAKDISNIIPRLMQSFVMYIKECADYNFPVAHFRIIAMLMDHPMKISDLAETPECFQSIDQRIGQNAV